MFLKAFTGLTFAGISASALYFLYGAKDSPEIASNEQLRVTPWQDDWDGKSLAWNLALMRNQSFSTLNSGRNIILIRHGEYTHFRKQDDKCKLTELGKQQAKDTAQRLIELEIPVSRFIHSSMTRARETAAIIYDELLSAQSPESSFMMSSSNDGPPSRLPRVEQFDELCEGWPCLAVPHHYNSAVASSSSSTSSSSSSSSSSSRSSDWPPSDNNNKLLIDEKRLRDADRIERAYQLLFYRPPAEQSSETYEIVVCHANVIRYFLCRALQLDAHAWLRFALHHGSISWVRINKRGWVSVLAVGDAGHIPAERLTISCKHGVPEEVSGKVRVPEVRGGEAPQTSS